MTVLEERATTMVPRGTLARLWDRDALTLAAVALLLPNILFALVSPWFLLRRMLSPLLYVVAAMIAMLLPWPLAFVVYAIATLIDAFFIFAFLFDMPVGTTLRSVQYASDIDIGASALYLGVIVYFVALAAALTYLTHRFRAPMRRASPLLAALIAAGIGVADFKINGYKPLKAPEFESAMASNGLTAGSIVARDRNLLVVIVEGMGAFADPEERRLLSDKLAAASAGRFRMATGTSNYYGSTTGAEARELCGVWGTYVNFLRRQIHDCLPEKLAAAGYHTVSYHASGSTLFSRREWYPRIGIQEMNFYEDIQRDRPEAIRNRCGSVFLGMCDADVGDLIHKDMLEGGSRRGMYYWLTLNSHIPYEPVPGNPLKCETSAAAIPSLIPCQLTEIWGEVFDRVAAIASDPDMPPVDIVIAGDHNTPLWSRDAYGHFQHTKVDWYYLEDQRLSAAKAPTVAAATN